MKLLSVQTMSELSGVSTHTLRAWERRHQAIIPQRTDSNRRQYSYEDLDRVRLLKELTENGLNISQIAPLETKELRKLQASLTKAIRQNQSVSPMPYEESEESELLIENPEIDQFIEQLKKMDLNNLNNQLTVARLSKSTPDFVINVASPLFQKVGQMVFDGELSISQEHAISALLRNQITQMILALSPLVNGNLPQIALTTREGDHHEFGIFLSQALCIYEGFPVIYLGPNLPASALAETINALNIEYTVIGSTPLPPEYIIVTLKNYITKLRGDLKCDTNIWLGGYLDDIDINFINKNNLTHAKSFIEFRKSIKKIKTQILEEN